MTISNDFKCSILHSYTNEQFTFSDDLFVTFCFSFTWKFETKKKETINNISTTQRNRKHVDVRERTMFEQAGNWIAIKQEEIMCQRENKKR